MNEMPRFTGMTLVSLLVVLGCAGGARYWYVATSTNNGEHDPALIVQGPAPTTHDSLVTNLLDHHAFRCQPPLADKEESTAFMAPGYPAVYAAVAYADRDAARTNMRWAQCVLGALTAGCYFFFARRAFHCTAVATLAGLFCAFHPFWIVNTAELNDGVLASFALSLALALGARASQNGGAFTALLFGLALAGVAMTRAALLPFAVVGLLCFLWHCRTLSLGWLVGFLALLGFANGIGPWCIRNYLEFKKPVAVADTGYLHVWMGNNPQATGSTMDERAPFEQLPEARRKALLDEPNEVKRYNQLANECWQEIQDHPTDTLSRRIDAALRFLFGDRWFKQHQLGQMQDKPEASASLPDWMRTESETILQGTLLGMFVLGLIGWRLSHAWRRNGRTAAIAALFVPLPYVLTHAEHLSGPRLPLDGVLLCYAALTLASLVPGLVCPPDRNYEPG